MERARNSSALKIVCYILIPILIALLGLSIFHIAFLEEYGVEEGQNDYTQTENFTDNYLYFFTNKIKECERAIKENEKDFIILEDSNGQSYYFSDNQNYNGIGAYIDYIIVDKETRKYVYKH